MSDRDGSTRREEVACALIFGAACLLLAPRLAAAQGEAAPPAPPSGIEAAAADLVPALPTADAMPMPAPAGATAPADAPAALPERRPPKAVARCEGTPAPGLQIVLTSAGSSADEATVRWVQVQGPPVALGDPSQRTLRVTVPEGAGPLGFLLVVASPHGVDTAALTIPIESWGRRPSGSSLVADAGDDQIGLVGRRITLNGIRSEPKGKLAYRWIQLSGPAVELRIEDGYMYSFIPPAPGNYRFALVVAADGEISEPARVDVAVAAPSAVAADVVRTSALVPAPAAPAPAAVVDMPVEELARAALATIDGGKEAAGALAEAFGAIAGRMELYGSYFDAYSEMSRRLDLIVPQDPRLRGVWAERLFAPLTARLVGEMLAVGLDLRRPDVQSAPLTAPQRARLADQFRAMAEGFRATVPVR